MGTRADFYVKKEKEMKWIASIAWDGYPQGIDNKVLSSKTEKSFLANLKSFLSKRDDVSYPEDGWPWPWNDSRTTDYAYIFEKKKVMASCFGGILFNPLIANEEDAEQDQGKYQNFFPDMRKIQKVDFGKRSGLIVISRK